MDITEATYPVFDANQVLTNAHLNDLFEYLDEQTRLTRANLIGIGIVCGLDLTFNGVDTIHLTKGCGITSEGYLILEPADVDLVAVRSYTLPTDYGYPTFVDATKQPLLQYPLWELIDDEDEAGAILLTDRLLGLSRKAVVLFLELRRDGLRNCAPNNCDDRGAQVTATLRRLLVDVSDLDKIIAAAPTSSTYLGADLTERLQLPDLRMPRFDVPNTGPVATSQVLLAFQETFRANGLAASTAAALTALYKAFRPVVVDLFPVDPFGAFLNRFGFLDSAPVTTGQVRFMQYYWDLFDDLFAAYDELRWKGADLIGACCPPADLFPRHLMVGVLDPDTHDAADYRHVFVPSPAVGDCADRSRQVRQLFRRLVTMLASFTEEVPNQGIKATPSRWNDAPVSAKAIPFYYQQGGTPPLYELWDPVKTGRRRANQNLGYRAAEYKPAPPAFVTDPLRYDLEPHNFLRIEGHLGLDVQVVLKTLLSLRKSHRLPFEVVALRTGAFDENAEVDVTKEECHFRDLETLYGTLKADLDCFLVKQIKYFYALPIPAAPGAPVDITGEPLVPTLTVLMTREPEFRAEPGTIGYLIEGALTWKPGQPYSWSFAVAGVPDLPGQVYALVGVMSNLAALLTDDLRQFDFTAMPAQDHGLVEIAARIEEIRRSDVYDAPGLSDRLDDIVFRCRLDPFKELVEEWKRRLREAKQAQFLGHFLKDHPGVQHKSGVPLGGTFVLVYHQPPTPVLSVALVAGPADEPREEISKGAAEVYAATVAELEEGTVIADFFLPYSCGPGCVTVQYQLPPSKLRVSTTTACTNTDGFAEVTVKTEGGTRPLSVRVDGGAFEELSGPLLLRVGDHTLVVRDSDGAGSLPVQVRIPPPLLVTEPRIEVNAGGDTWQVSFTVEGGTPSYVADVGTIVDRTFTSPALLVREELTVEIKDAAGCTVQGRFESSVTPCDLPCGGEAVREGYRFWLPEAREGQPINRYTPRVTSFLVTDADGKLFDLTADVANVIRPVSSPISTADFEPKVNRWLGEINARIAAAVGSDDWLNLAYEAPAGKAVTGTLFIDRLRCLEIAFELDVSFVQGQRPRRVQLGYSSRGTVIVDPDTDSKARIPVFGASTSNKCRPDEPPVPVCEGTDLKLEIERQGAIPDAVVLMAVTSGADQPAAFFWEVQDGIPFVAGGETVSFTFKSTEPVEKLVSLTVFTEKGCFVTREQLIDISKPDG